MIGCIGITDYAAGKFRSHHRIALAGEIITAGLEALAATVRVINERASRRLIEFFTAIRNHDTRLVYVRAVKQFFDLWCADP